MNPSSSPDFKLLFESAPGLYLILTPDFTIVQATDAYLSATMTKREQILGRNLFAVFPDNPNDKNASGTANLLASLLRVLENRASDSMPIQKYDIPRLASLGGGFEERHWSPTNYPVFGHSQELKYILHCVEDVTDFVKLKQEGMRQHQEAAHLRTQVDTAEKLRQSQRMEAMGQLAGGVAHDFNNLLAVTILNCDSMLTGEGLSESVKKGVEQIKKTAEQAASLTRQLLAFSRKQVLQPKPMNINSVITNMGTMLKRLLPEDIELKTNLNPDLGNTRADVGQIEQILLNLVVNARDAMSGCGKITIETTEVDLDKAMTEGTPQVERGRYIVLAVHDTGVGMDAKTQARIFEPFFTTKGVGKGTGLGLATVYGIVTQNKGTIGVHSELKKGSVFKVFLPLVHQSVEAIAPLESAPQSVKGTETILVVEDQEDLRQLICVSLKANGYQVFEAPNGLKGLAVVKEQPRAFHLVITDVVMPEMGGQLLAEKVTELNPDLKILFLSGYTEDTLTSYGVSGRHPHFLEKPFNRKAMLQKVRMVLGQTV